MNMCGSLLSISQDPHLKEQDLSWVEVGMEERDRESSTSCDEHSIPWWKRRRSGHKREEKQENLQGTLRKKSQRSTKLILKGAEKQISVQSGHRNRKYTLNVIKWDISHVTVSTLSLPQYRLLIVERDKSERCKFSCYISVKSRQLAVLRKIAVNRALACFICSFTDCINSAPRLCSSPLRSFADLTDSPGRGWDRRGWRHWVCRAQGQRHRLSPGTEACTSTLNHSASPWGPALGPHCWRTRGLSRWKANQIFQSQILLKMFCFDELEL